MKLIALHPEDIVVLLEQSHLPKRDYFSLYKNEVYGFYTNTKIYGLYRVKRITKQFYYLRKNSFRPLQLFAPHKKNLELKNSKANIFSDSTYLKQTWVNRNRFRESILLLQHTNKSTKTHTLRFYHQDLPGFSYTLKIPITTKLNALIKNIRVIFSTPTQGNLSALIKLGRELSTLINSEELFSCLKNRTVYYKTIPSNMPLLPLGVLFKEDFLIKHTILQHFYKTKKMIASKPKNRLSNFVLITSDEDEFMQTEKKEILKVFDKKKYFSYQAHTLSANIPELDSRNIGEIMENASVLHIITHGRVKRKDFCFFQGENPLFSLNSLSKIKVTPSLVVLSACESENERLLRFFFERGTQTIITTIGLLFSKNLALVWSGFYERLLVDKLTVKESFALMLRRLAQLNDINAVKLTLHGYGKERLYSFQ